MRVTLENGERQILLARLGLPDSTSDPDLATAAAARLLAEPTPAPSPSPTPPAPTPDPVAGPPAPNPAPDPDPAPSPEPVPDSDGVVVLDIAAFQGLNRRASMAERIQEEQRVIERDTLITGAVRVGKFPPGRQTHYAARYDSDPDGTRRDIDRMAPNVVPIHERGKDAPEEDIEAQSDAYPEEWVKGAHGPRPANSDRTASRVHGEE